MNNSQKGSVSVLALLFASFLLSLGGAGAAASYFQKDPNDFLAQLHAYFATHVDAADLAPLDATPTVTQTPTGTPSPTPTPTVTVTDTPTPTPTPVDSITPTPTGKPSIVGAGDDDGSEEEIHESSQAKVHEHEDDDSLGAGVSGQSTVEIGD